MNSAQITQRNNMIFFFVTLLLSIALLTVSALTLTHVLSGDADGESHEASACRQMFNSIGMAPTLDPATGDLTIRKLGADNLEFLVVRSSLLLAYCPGFKIKSYCAGECAPTGINMVLTPREK